MSKQSKQQSTAERLIRTDNEHWNGFALRFLCSAKEGGLFTDLDQAMELYDKVTDVVVDLHAEPLKADHAVAKLLEGLTEPQRVAIYQGALSYLQGTSYGEEVDLGPVLAILKGRAEEPDVPTWGATARTKLRDLVKAELEALPTTLSLLEPKDRVAFLAKLIPYVLPKGEERHTQSTTW